MAKFNASGEMFVENYPRLSLLGEHNPFILLSQILPSNTEIVRYGISRLDNNDFYHIYLDVRDYRENSRYIFSAKYVPEHYYGPKSDPNRRFDPSYLHVTLNIYEATIEERKAEITNVFYKLINLMAIEDSKLNSQIMRSKTKGFHGPAEDLVHESLYGKNKRPSSKGFDYS